MKNKKVLDLIMKYIDYADRNKIKSLNENKIDKWNYYLGMADGLDIILQGLE